MKIILLIISAILLPTICFSHNPLEEKFDPGPIDPVLEVSKFDETASIKLSIENSTMTYEQDTDTISVYLKCPIEELGGFDIKIGVDSSLIKFIDILPGDFYNNCRWEMFRGRPARFNNYLNDRYQLWQVIAIADMASDTTKPKCFSCKFETSLLKIIIKKNTNIILSDTIAPIFFLWEDCTDNSMADKDGNKLYLSLTSIDKKSVAVFDSESFPNSQGNIEECIKGTTTGRLKRMIEFHNGGVKLKAIDTTN